MLTLTVKQHFSAAHSIPAHSGECKKLHGHTWVAEARFTFSDNSIDGPLGISIDFQRVKQVMRKHLPDHEYLNPLFAPIAPTAENIAKHLYERIQAEIPELSSLTIWESENCAATYTRDSGDRAGNQC